MAMTKKERAELDALKQENARLRALLTAPLEPPARDIPAGSEDKLGWDIDEYAFSLSGGSLTGAVFASFSFDGRALFSTRLLALQALRAECAHDCGNALAVIDAAIEKEERA